jgi:hypothetical protein
MFSVFVHCLVAFQYFYFGYCCNATCLLARTVVCIPSTHTEKTISVNGMYV